MKYATFLPGGSPETLIAWAQKIEAAGFDSLVSVHKVNNSSIVS